VESDFAWENRWQEAFFSSCSLVSCKSSQLVFQKGTHYPAQCPSLDLQLPLNHSEWNWSNECNSKTCC
jgi:hypothetical protein